MQPLLFSLLPSSFLPIGRRQVGHADQRRRMLQPQHPLLEIRSYLVCRMTNTYIPATSTACIYWLADITVCIALRSTSENFVPCYSFGLPFSSGSFVKVQA